MNEKIFLAINGLAGKSEFLDVVGVFLASKFLYLFALLIVVLWWDKKVRNNVYLAIGAALFSRAIIVEALKRLVNHPRPYEIITNMHQLLIDNDRGVSFPSGHTVIFFAFAFAFYKTRYFWPFLVLASLGSVARVFVGVHFPNDVAASIVIAGVTVWCARSLFKKSLLG